MSEQDFFDDGRIKELAQAGFEDLSDEELVLLYDYELVNGEGAVRSLSGRSKPYHREPIESAISQRLGKNAALWRLGREPKRKKWDADMVEYELRGFEHVFGRPPSSTESANAFHSNPVTYIDAVTTYEELLERAGMPYRLVIEDGTIDPGDEDDAAERYLHGDESLYYPGMEKKKKRIISNVVEEYNRWTTDRNR